MQTRLTASHFTPGNGFLRSSSCDCPNLEAAHVWVNSLVEHLFAQFTVLLKNKELDSTENLHEELKHFSSVGFQMTLPLLTEIVLCGESVFCDLLLTTNSKNPSNWKKNTDLFESMHAPFCRLLKHVIHSYCSGCVQKLQTAQDHVDQLVFRKDRP